MEPIFIHQSPESLEPHPVCRESRDEDEISKHYPLQHSFCNGITSRKKVANDFDTISCGCCGLRIIIPHGIKTYAELREFLSGEKIQW